MNVGKKSAGKIIPTNRLFEKSGDGNKRKPTINPTIMDKHAVFSVKRLLVVSYSINLSLNNLISAIVNLSPHIQGPFNERLSSNFSRALLFIP